MNDKITESKNPKSSSLDKMSITEIVELINEEDSKISRVIKEIIPQIKPYISSLSIYDSILERLEPKAFVNSKKLFLYSN